MISLTDIRVFLAEDEPMLLWALEEFLADLGCRVVGTAGRVADALRFVADHEFDIAVLDGKLADGPIEPVIELLARRRLPFVLATGLSASQFGPAIDRRLVLQKPYSIAQLQLAMAAALGRVAEPVATAHTGSPA